MSILCFLPPYFKSIYILLALRQATTTQNQIKLIWLYRREGNLADVFIGDPQTILLETTLRGGNISKQPLHCEIRSPWFDIDMKSEPSKDDSYHYSYKKAEKVRWLTHDEINSGEFKDLIDKSVDCFEKLRLNVQLTKKEPIKKA